MGSMTDGLMVLDVKRTGLVPEIFHCGFNILTALLRGRLVFGVIRLRNETMDFCPGCPPLWIQIFARNAV